MTGTYIDTFTALNGCDSIRRLNLFVTPKLSSTSEKSICIGETYLRHKSTGTYVDTLHTNAGCDSVVTTILKVQNKPAPYFNSNTEICLGDSIILNPGTFLSYKWQDNSTLKQFVVKKEGIYQVSVTNSCGSANAAVVIKNRMCQYSFPTAFTPNNDGKNDRFKILNAFNLKKFSLSIYNRYGQKVFETNDYSIGWDGIYQGLPGDTGVYVWYCSFEEAGVQSKIKGTTVLLR